MFINFILPCCEHYPGRYASKITGWYTADSQSFVLYLYWKYITLSATAFISKVSRKAGLCSISINADILNFKTVYTNFIYHKLLSTI